MPHYIALLLVGACFALFAAAADNVPTPVNVTVDNVVLHLTDSNRELGERYYLNKQNSLTITCRAEAESSVQLVAPGSFEWRKIGANQSLVGKDPRASQHVECAGSRCVSTLVIRYPRNSDAGDYNCLVTPKHHATGVPAKTVTASGGFLSRPLITLLVEKNDNYDLPVWPSDTVEVTCLVQGSPVGKIRWSKSLDANFSIEGNTTLSLSGLSYEDRGDLTCTADNNYGTNSATMFLRVRSPKAFLCPLVIIGLEVLVMLVIIVSYEIVQAKRRRAKMAEANEGDAAKPDGGVDSGAAAPAGDNGKTE